MTRRLMLLVIATLMGGCPPSTLRPSITVTTGEKLLTINGSGFANVARCAHMSLQGLPPPSSSIVIGDAQCSAGGSFQNYNWQYNYSGCDPGAPQSATVFAVDTQGSNAGASQSVSIPWGANCSITGTCGAAGQAPCPGGTCMAGTTFSGGICIAACGAEGQPACTSSTGGYSCQSGTDLHPNFQGGQVICTWSCGHTQGSPCPASGGPGCSGNPPTLTQPQSPCEVPLSGTDLTNGGIYTCYYPGMIDTAGNCTCVPNTINNCPVSTSIPKPPAPNSGQCVQGQFKDNQGSGCFQ